MRLRRGEAAPPAPGPPGADEPPMAGLVGEYWGDVGEYWGEAGEY